MKKTIPEDKLEIVVLLKLEDKVHQVLVPKDKEAYLLAVLMSFSDDYELKVLEKPLEGLLIEKQP